MKKCGFFLVVFLSFLLLNNQVQGQWTKADGPCAGSILCIAANETEMYVGTGGGGVYRSTDGGASFTFVNSNMWSTTIIALYLSSAGIMAGTGGSGVFLSTDQGSTWQERNYGLTQGNINSFASVGIYIFAATPGGGVFRSSDNGSNWAAVNTGLTQLNVNKLCASGTRLFAGTTNGIFVSQDNGATWTDASSNLSNKNITAIKVVGNKIFIGNNNGVCFGELPATTSGNLSIRDNFTISWSIPWVNINKPVKSIETDGNIVFAATSSGCYRSYNSGNSWQTNSLDAYISANTLFYKGPTLFCGGFGLWTSNDAGNNWQSNLNDGISFATVNGVLVADGDIFAGIYGRGIAKSTDGGDTWVLANNGVTSTDITSFTTLGTTIIAGSGLDSKGIYWSNNGGDSWENYLNGKAVNGFATVTGGPDGTLLFAATSDGIYSSPDGKIWTRNTQVPSNEITDISFDGARGICTRYGLINPFITSDYGRNWIQTPSRPPSSCNALETYGNDFIAGTYYGIFHSIDNGGTWQTYDELPNLNVNCLQRMPNTDQIVAATQTDGLWLLEDGEWTEINYGLPSWSETIYDVSTDGNTVGAGFFGGILISTITDLSNGCGPAQKISPENDETDVSINTPFSWSNPPGATTITLTYNDHDVIAPVKTFQIPAQGISQSFIPPDPLPYNTYIEWNVTSDCHDELWTANKWNFTTEELVIPAELMDPENGETGVEIKPFLKWKNASNAVTVELMVLDSLGNVLFTYALAAAAGEIQLYEMTDALNYSTKYQWKIITISDQGEIPTGPWTFTTICPLPEKIAPENEERYVDIKPTFVWENSPGTHTIHLMVNYTNDSDSLINLEYNIEVEGDRQEFELPVELPYNKIVIWELTNDCAASDYNEFSFKTEGKPCELSSPADEDDNVDIRPLFMWHNADDATGVEIYIYDFSGNVLHTYSLPVTEEYQSFSIPDTLDYWTTYGWAIISITEAGEQATQTNHFSTECSPPRLISPENGAVNQSQTPTLVWRNSLEAKSVELILCWKVPIDEERDSTIFLRYNLSADVFEQRFTIPETDALPVNKEITWWVLSDCTSDSWVHSDLEIFSFNTRTGKCQLAIPSNGAEGKSISPLFGWINSDDAVRVLLSIFDSTGVEVFHYEMDALAGERQVFEMTDKLKYSTKYQWNVYTSSGDINQWEASETFWFTTGCAPAKKISPQDMAASVSVKPTFSWTNEKGVTQVQLHLSYREVLEDSTYTIDLLYELDASEGTHSFQIPDLLPSNKIITWAIYNDCEAYEEDETWTFTTGGTTFADDQEIPTTYALDQNYPNPFNPATVIGYQLPQEGPVLIKLFDALGKEIKVLVNENKSPGKYKINFNAENLSSGIYLIYMKSKDYVQTRKMILLR